MRKYISILGLSLAAMMFVVTGCNESVDNITADAKEGAVTDMGTSTGKVLGSPDAATGVVTFLDVAVDYAVDVTATGTGVNSLNIVKEVSGQGSKVTIENPSTWPYTLSYSSISEVLDGTGVSEGDLRIGDVITVWTEINMADGRVLVNNSTKLIMTIQCLSDLEGTYAMTGEDDTGYTYAYDVDIAEVAPGEYSFKPTCGYIAVAYGYSGDYALATQFFDVCNVLTIPNQGLGSGAGSYGAFSNPTEGSGIVNADGSIDFSYTVDGFGLQSDHLVPK